MLVPSQLWRLEGQNHGSFFFFLESLMDPALCLFPRFWLVDVSFFVSPNVGKSLMHAKESVSP